MEFTLLFLSWWWQLRMEGTESANGFGNSGGEKSDAEKPRGGFHRKLTNNLEPLQSPHDREAGAIETGVSYRPMPTASIRHDVRNNRSEAVSQLLCRALKL